jgi:hypothetical protein
VNLLAAYPTFESQFEELISCVKNFGSSMSLNKKGLPLLASLSDFVVLL